jgi:hypothetical protein
MIGNPLREERHVRVPVGPRPFVPSVPDDPGTSRKVRGSGHYSLDGLRLGVHSRQIDAGQYLPQLDYMGVGLHQPWHHHGPAQVHHSCRRSPEIRGAIVRSNEDYSVTDDGDRLRIRAPTMVCGVGRVGGGSAPKIGIAPREAIHSAVQQEKIGRRRVCCSVACGQGEEKREDPQPKAR